MSEFSLALNEDLLALQKWIHEFAVDVIRPNAEEWDEREEFPWPVVKQAAEIGLYFFPGGLIVFLPRQLAERLKILAFLPELPPFLQGASNGFRLTYHGLRLFRKLPKARIAHTPFKLRDLGFLRFYVKDTPADHPAGACSQPAA